MNKLHLHKSLNNTELGSIDMVLLQKSRTIFVIGLVNDHFLPYSPLTGGDSQIINLVHRN
jgi:hypothetical protein